MQSWSPIRLFREDCPISSHFPSLRLFHRCESDAYGRIQEIGISRWYISFTSAETFPKARSNTLCAGRLEDGTNLESSSNSNLVSFSNVNTLF